MGVTSSQLAALDQTAADISGSAASYLTAAETMATPADCATAVQEYSSQVQPDVDRIATMSSQMDGALSSMGQGMGADMECGATVMQQELAHHRAVACTSPDMSTNQAEAARHVEAMQEYADHMRMRADELTRMMSANGGMGGGMMGGSTDTTGGGWTTRDGGTIPFDQTMPGCTYANGSFQPAGGSSAGGASGGGQ
jgi:hypothetical protein